LAACSSQRAQLQLSPQHRQLPWSPRLEIAACLDPLVALPSHALKFIAILLCQVDGLTYYFTELPIKFKPQNLAISI
jgi:hypothetical protein